MLCFVVDCDGVLIGVIEGVYVVEDGEGFLLYVGFDFVVFVVYVVKFGGDGYGVVVVVGE